jgi:lipopolysaccharide transport system ATP-binding protein
MSNDVTLRTVDLGKMYRIGGEHEQYRTLRDTLAKMVKKPIERIRHPGAASHVSVDLWALRHIDLEIREGEVVGIIGRNGSGKSTLLKVLSHITEPTEGRAEIRGKVGSLLEVGTGFHKELTGRENIQMNGAILGLSRAEIRRKFDDIVAFAGIEKFMDTPVKRYSSGMYVRLAFAVAAHLEPDILLVDEVLAVGDAEFQAKCLNKMGEAASSGRTVLLVSHNMPAVSNLCQRALLLDGGRLVADGPADEVISKYLQSGRHQGASADLSTVWRPHWARPWLRTARIVSPDGQAAGELRMGEDVTVEVTLASPDGSSVRCPVLVVEIVSARLGRVAGVSSAMTGESVAWPEANRGLIRCRIKKPPLLPGEYVVDLALGGASNTWADLVRSALAFKVVEGDYYGTGQLPGPGYGVFYLDAGFEAAIE